MVLVSVDLLGPLWTICTCCQIGKGLPGLGSLVLLALINVCVAGIESWLEANRRCVRVIRRRHRNPRLLREVVALVIIANMHPYIIIYITNRKISKAPLRAVPCLCVGWVMRHDQSNYDQSLAKMQHFQPCNCPRQPSAARWVP